MTILEKEKSEAHHYLLIKVSNYSYSQALLPQTENYAFSCEDEFLNKQN